MCWPRIACLVESRQPHTSTMNRALGADGEVRVHYLQWATFEDQMQFRQHLETPVPFRSIIHWSFAFFFVVISPLFGATRGITQRERGAGQKIKEMLKCYKFSAFTGIAGENIIPQMSKPKKGDKRSGSCSVSARFFVCSVFVLQCNRVVFHFTPFLANERKHRRTKWMAKI